MLQSSAANCAASSGGTVPEVIAAERSGLAGGVAAADGAPVAAAGAALGVAEAAAPVVATGDGVLSAARASPAGRPCLVALALGVPAAALGAAVPVAAGAAAGVPVAPADGVALGAGAWRPLGARARTGRKNSFAVVPTWSAAVCLSPPLGMFTMMLRSPWVCTSASETPIPLTRCSMIPVAMSMLDLLIALGSLDLALSVMLVPPARSIPRRGLVLPVPNMRATSPTVTTRMRASARPG